MTLEENDDIITRVFTVKEDQGCAGMILGCVPEGYQVTKIDREGTRATATYKKING